MAVTERLESDARALAATWVDGFAEALAAHDPGRLAALFRPDGSWRDVLAVTGQGKGVPAIQTLMSPFIAAWSRP